MKNLMLLLVFASLLLGCQKKIEGEKVGQKIRQIMQGQEDCWNSGDLECFMEGYWKSDSLVFIGSSGPKYGWETTLSNYKKSYPDQRAMGKLKFNLLKIETISPDASFVIGQWKLTRADGDLAGHFTLLWRKIDSEWVIVADHSS